MNRLEVAKNLFLEGLALFSSRDYPAAESRFTDALALAPDRVSILTNLSATLIKQKKTAQAREFAERAIQADPQAFEGWLNKGICAFESKAYEEAAASFVKTLALKPDYDYALGLLMDARLWSCDWQDYSETAAEITRRIQQGRLVMGPFSFLTLSNSAADQFICARHYAQAEYPVPAVELPALRPYHHDKIRLAYVSADFHDHATSYLMAELFERHDKNRFELSAWSFGPDATGGMRARLLRSFDAFINVRDLTDLQVAQLMREKEIDIAVDLKGFTTDCRPGIFAHRPAPLQVSYLGYPGTMGVDYIDYLLGDRWVTPTEHEPFYTEQIVRLPHSYQVNDSQRKIAEASSSRQDERLPAQGFVFCCFNNNYKITPTVFDVWMRLLHQVPGSVLWLLQDNPAAANNLQAEARQRGIAPERLVFARRVNLPEHLARQRLADLFLDTLPINAHTTASDALWAGLPVLTCLGDGFAGRVAASLLHAVGLPELVTHSLADYEALALQLATTPAQLIDLRTRLARQRLSHPLFDSTRFCQAIEHGYLTMHHRHQAGMAPQGFDIPEPA
jgi:protein O-GlcNAc transferase